MNFCPQKKGQDVKVNDNKSWQIMDKIVSILLNKFLKFQNLPHPNHQEWLSLFDLQETEMGEYHSPLRCEINKIPV